MSDTDFDVVIAAYLIPDLAGSTSMCSSSWSGQAAEGRWGRALVSVDPDGNVTVDETGDHLGRKGLTIGGGVGLVVGLLALRCWHRSSSSAQLEPLSALQLLDPHQQPPLGCEMFPTSTGSRPTHPRAVEQEVRPVSNSEDAATTQSSGPKVLFVYYTFTKQAARVADAMAEVLRGEGWEVTEAAIEFTDKRYSAKFHKFPFDSAFLDVVRMLPAQARRKTGEIRVPPEAAHGGYDLVVVGSPTWWLTTCMPVRSFLESPEGRAVLSGTPFAGYVVCRRYWGNNLKSVKRLGTKQGGKWVDGLHFAYEGGQVRSLLSLISYLGTGENRPRYLGVKIPPTNLPTGFEVETEAFAHKLAASVDH